MVKKSKSLVETRALHYQSLTAKALKKAQIVIPKSGSLYAIAADFKEMA